MANSNIYALASETKLKLVATHKKTFTTFEKEITYGEWVNFAKHKDYYYLTYQV